VKTSLEFGLGNDLMIGFKDVWMIDFVDVLQRRFIDGFVETRISILETWHKQVIQLDTT
jgi:hypothetical protein